MQKIKSNNPNLDIVFMDAYIKFGENLPICSQDIDCKQNSGVNQGPLLCYKCAKSNDLELVKINVYIKYCDILLICSQDIEQKRKFGVNQVQ